MISATRRGAPANSSTATVGWTWWPSRTSSSVNPVVGQRRPDRPGRAVVQRGHGVEGVGEQTGAGAEGASGEVEVGLGVTDGDGDPRPTSTGMASRAPGSSAPA